jgi:hypothetical protein
VKREPRTPRETLIMNSILEVLQAEGVWCWRVNCGDVPAPGGGVFHGAPPGTPDILGVFPDSGSLRGRLFGIEVKTPIGKLNPAQRAWRDRAAKAGVFFGVARSWREALELMWIWVGHVPKFDHSKPRPRNVG